MARDNIVDKSSPPKSEWFGYKYKVTPETSKLLQETVFKDGGKWLSGSKDVYCLESTDLYVKDNGDICTGEIWDKLDQHLGIKSGNNATTNVGDINMSNQNRVVSVKFFDDDAGLKAENSLVAEYQITTRVSDTMTVSKVLLTEDVAGDIAMHNEVRAATVDLHILKQTGNKVMLTPIEFEDLRVEVRQV